MNKYILGIDIGGTNTRFCLFYSELGKLKRVDSEWVNTSEFKSFIDLLDKIPQLKIINKSFNFSSVVFAAAGPVSLLRYCDPPNIPWAIDLEDAKNFFSNRNSFSGAKLFLINDFIAQAFCIFSELGNSSLLIKEGVETKSKETVAIIGPGTGLGKAILVCDQKSGKFIGVPSEGGHALFPISSKEEYDFYQFACNKLGVTELSFENLVCGQSLSLMYEFFESKELPPSEVAEIISMNHSDPLKKHPVIDLYAKFFARACKTFCLESYSTGGLYIMGGVVGKNPYLVQNEVFLAEFTKSKAMSKILKSIQIKLIINQESGLYGASQYALLNGVN